MHVKYSIAGCTLIHQVTAPMLSCVTSALLRLLVFRKQKKLLTYRDRCSALVMLSDLTLTFHHSQPCTCNI